MARSLKFRIKGVEGYLCSENEGGDKLCSYCVADPHMQKTTTGFLMTRLIFYVYDIDTIFYRGHEGHCICIDVSVDLVCVVVFAHLSK